MKKKLDLNYIKYKFELRMKKLKGIGLVTQLNNGNVQRVFFAHDITFRMSLCPPVFKGSVFLGLETPPLNAGKMEVLLHIETKIHPKSKPSLCDHSIALQTLQSLT